MYDIIIIGAGAAGMAAALYTCRRKLKTLVISMDTGGQTLLTTHIENYPGATKLSGTALMDIFDQQMLAFGAEKESGKVVSVRKNSGQFSVLLTDGRNFESRSVILAMGKEPKTLGIPGEDKFIGRGVSLTTTTDVHQYKGKKVAIVGGGNSAVEGALLAAATCSKVYLVHRRAEFRAEAITVDKLKQKKNIELVLNTVPVEVKGTEHVEALVVEDVNSGKRREIVVDAVFVQVGLQSPGDITHGLVTLNEKKEIVVDNVCNTGCPGLFAAGDLTSIPYKQTVVSAGEGVKAALEAYRHVTGKKTVIDWDH